MTYHFLKVKFWYISGLIWAVGLQGKHVGMKPANPSECPVSEAVPTLRASKTPRAPAPSLSRTRRNWAQRGQATDRGRTATEPGGGPEPGSCCALLTTRHCLEARTVRQMKAKMQLLVQIPTNPPTVHKAAPATSRCGQQTGGVTPKVPRYSSAGAGASVNRQQSEQRGKMLPHLCASSACQ